MHRRDALLICCSEKEAGKIRGEAKSEHRGVSSYVLSVTLRALRIEDTILARTKGKSPTQLAYLRDPGPRTEILVRCSNEEAAAIRTHARRRGVSISGYALMALRRVWSIKAQGPSLSAMPGIRPPC